MIEDMRLLPFAVCLAGALLVGCDDADEETPQQPPPLAEVAGPARPAPNPQRESLSISNKKKAALPSFNAAPRFNRYSLYNGEDIRQVTGVSGRTLWLCFTAPWCSHSKAMIRELKIVAQEEKGTVQVVEVNADAYVALAEEFDITKVPTTFIYTEGVKLDKIEGAYNAASLRRFLHDTLANKKNLEAPPPPFP